MTGVERVDQYDAPQRYRSNVDMITLGKSLNVSLIINERTWCFRWWELSMLRRRADVVLQKSICRFLVEYHDSALWVRETETNENLERKSVWSKNLGTFQFSVGHLTSMEKVRKRWGVVRISLKLARDYDDEWIEWCFVKCWFEQWKYFVLSWKLVVLKHLCFPKNKIDFRVCFDLSTIPLILSAHSIINSWKNKSSLCWTNAKNKINSRR